MTFQCVPEKKIFYTFNYTDKDFGINHDADFTLDDSSNTFTISTDGELMAATKLDASIQVLYNVSTCTYKDRSNKSKNLIACPFVHRGKQICF